MKKLLILVLILPFFSCSPSDDGTENGDPSHSGPAMTAKINGNFFEANNPFGTNEYSEYTIWNYYPPEQFIVLQGRQGAGFGATEINIWL